MRLFGTLLLVAAIAVGLWSTRTPPRAAVASRVTALHGALSTLAPGDVVVVAVDFDPASRPELEPFVSLTIDAALVRKARVVTLSLWPHGAMLGDAILRRSLAAHGGEYGVDALSLGFVEGRGAAVHVLGLPLGRAFSRDYAGDAIADLPLARDIVRLSDAALTVVASSSAPGIYEWLLQGQGRFSQHMVAGTTSLQAPEIEPFFASGQLEGLAGGSRDVAALADLLAHDPRMMTPQLMTSVATLTAQMRAQRWAHIALLLALVVGQTIYIVRRRGGRTPTKGAA